MNITPIDPKLGKEVFEDLLNVPEKNRPWTINVIVIILAIAICMATFFVFQSQKSQAVQDKLRAEAETKILREQITSGATRCPDLIQAAVDRRDLYWSAKFDNLQERYTKDLKDRADKWDNKLNYLSKETERVKEQAKQLNNKIKR